MLSRLFRCETKDGRRQGPVGAPAEQCWQYTLRSAAIEGGVHRAGTAAFDGDRDDCVALQSASVEDGVATWVICCVKDDSGRCKNCFTALRLEVYDANDRAKVVAKRAVTIECAPGP